MNKKLNFEFQNEIHNAVTDLAKEEKQWDFSVG